MQLKTLLSFARLAFPGLAFAGLTFAACTHLAGAPTITGAPGDPGQILATAPLRFEASPDSPSTFIARGARYQFAFTPGEATLRSGAKEVRLSFAGANSRAAMHGAQPLASTTNLYLGNDPSRWHRAIPNFGRLRVDALYPGIDLAYYGNGRELEYDLTVNPNADAREIRLRLSGDHSDARIDSAGDLVAALIQKKPVAYQIGTDGRHHSVAARYRKNGDGTFGFQLGAYDRSRALVIDPTIHVAQYVAGSFATVAYSIGHDSRGLVYIGGSTASTDLTLAGTPYQKTEGGGQDLFLAVVNPTLAPSAQIIYVTYIGGSQDDTFGAMSVSPSGDVYMTGSTASTNFPLQNGAQGTLGGSSGSSDAFVLKLTSFNSLAYSTLYGGGGTDKGTAISVASNGWIWVAGNTQSSDLPVSSSFQNSLIGQQNMFIAVFNPANSGSATRLYAIYIGGTHWDEAFGIAPAPDGTVWIAGGTFSPDIWIQGNAYQGKYGGSEDGYIAHVNPNLGANSLVYASFFGGSEIDEITSLVLDPSGNLILSGYTLSDNFPVTTNAYQTKYGGDTDAFITVLNTAKKELVYSTYFGGAEPDASMDLKEDKNGMLYLTGFTESGGLPSTSGALQPSYDGSLDAFALKLDPSKDGAAGIQYFTYLGSDGTQVGYGVDFDSFGDMYVAGYSSAAILSHFGAARPNNAGDWDAFVIGFTVGSPAPAIETSLGHPHHRHLPFRVSPHR